MSANIKNININRSYLHAGGATENNSTQQQMGAPNVGNPTVPNNGNPNNGAQQQMDVQNVGNTNNGTQQQIGVQNVGNPTVPNNGSTGNTGNTGNTHTPSPQNFNIAKTASLTDGYSVSSSGTSISDASSITSDGDASSIASEDELGIFRDPLRKGDDDDELGSMDGGASTVSTAEILAKDPLFLVLSEFFMDEKGNTIVHTLSKVAKNIEKLDASVEKLCKTIEKSNKK
jgi:hypothetical protein